MNAFKVNTQQNKSRVRTATVARSIAKMALWLAIVILATAPSFAQPGSAPDGYLGIWRRYSNGKMAGTVELVNYKGKVTGTYSGSAGSPGENGAIQMYGVPGAMPIVESSLSGSDLHLVIAGPADDTYELKMTLDGSDKAHLTCYAKHGQVEFDLKKVSYDENETVHVQY